MHSTTGRGRDCQSLDSAVLANKESASPRSAISVPQGWGLIRTEFSVSARGAVAETTRLGSENQGTFAEPYAVARELRHALGTRRCRRESHEAGARSRRKQAHEGAKGSDHPAVPTTR